MTPAYERAVTESAEAVEVIGCEWVEQIAPTIAARDWVVRQLVVYEIGGLRLSPPRALAVTDLANGASIMSPIGD
jgi:hypothetical protein